MGILNSNTFHDFFQSKFMSERAYLKFNPSHFENIYQEMASRGVGENLGDVVKRPLNLDQDDINFLDQFPVKLRIKALQTRYEMLHDELINLHEKRMNLGFEDIQKEIKSIMTDIWKGNSANWDSLRGKISDDVLDRLQRDYTKENITTLGKTNAEIYQKIEDEAHAEAYEEVKSKSDFIEEPSKPIEFTFGKEKILAHPFLNRLYQKIERTRTFKHHSHSGLHDFGVTHGQYGYDLAFPKKQTKETTKNGKKKSITFRTTRGAGGWPSAQNTKEAIQSLINLNHHQVFGKLEIPENAEWRVVLGSKGKGEGPMKDIFTYNQAREKHEKDISKKLTIGIHPDYPNEIIHFPTNSDKNKEAKRLSFFAVEKDIESGKLISSPVPQVNPNGSHVVNAVGQPVTDADRIFRFDGDKKDKKGLRIVVYPDIYLPQIPKKIKKIKSGNEVEETHWSPILNPAKYYRKLGTDESDFIRDEDGKSTGEIDKEALKNRVTTGHAGPDGLQPYVVLDPEEYEKEAGKGHQAPAAFHINQNSKGRFFISSGDPRYKILYNAIFGNDETGQTYKDDDSEEKNEIYEDNEDSEDSEDNEEESSESDQDESSDSLSLALKNADPPMILKKDKSVNSPLWNDFRAGILSCAASGKCGDAGDTERTAIRQSLVSLHGVVVTNALRTLGDPKLLKSTGRRAFARNMMASFAQTNLGDGPRRLRIKERKLRNISRDFTSAGTTSIEDEVDEKDVDRKDFVTSDIRKRGGRHLPPIDWIDEDGKTSYNVEGLRQKIAQMKEEALEADRLGKEIAFTPQDLEQIKNLILDRERVVKGMHDSLVRIYLKNNSTGRSPDAIDKEVTNEINGWIKSGHSTSEQIVAKFESHPLVVAELTGKESEANPEEKIQRPKTNRQLVSPEAEEIWSEFKKSNLFKSIKDLQSKNDPKIWGAAKQGLEPRNNEKYCSIIENWVKEFLEDDKELRAAFDSNSEAILTSLQDFLDDEFNLNSSEEIITPAKQIQKPTIPTQPTSTVAAREIERPATTSENPEHKGSIYDPNSASEHLGQLKKEKRWHDFINHPEFHIWSLNAAWYPQLQSKVNNWLQQGWITPAQQQAAQARIAYAMNMPRNEL